MELSRGNVVEDLIRWRDYYLQHCNTKGIGPRSREIYSGIMTELTEYIKNNSPYMHIGKLDWVFINDFMRFKEEKRGKLLSDRTFKLYYTVIKAWFVFISEEITDPDNTIDLGKNVAGLKRKVKRKTVVGYTPDQTDKLEYTVENLKELHRKKPKKSIVVYRNALIFKILLYTGIRAIEMSRLTYQDLESYTSETDGIPQYRILVVGKGDNERYVYIDRVEVDEELAVLSRHFTPDSLIAVSRTGKPLGPVQINHNISRLAKAAGMTKRGVHIYRHTFAQKKISENVNMETLRQALGHSDIGITAAFYAANSEKNKSDAFSSSKNRR